MRAADVIHGLVTTAEVRRVDGEPFVASWTRDAEVSLTFDDRDGTALRLGSEVQPVVGASPRDVDVLRQAGVRSLPSVAWIAEGVTNGRTADRLLVQCHEFPSSFTWNERVEFGIDDRIVEELRRRNRRQMNVESAVQWLSDQFLLEPANGQARRRVLLSGTPGAAAGRKTAFRLYGARYACDVEASEDQRARVTRIVETRRALRGDEAVPIHLAYGDLSFCDETVAGQFRGVARTELDALVARADSYLGLWKQYNTRERESVLRRARAFGWVAYTSCRPLGDGRWRFDLAVAPDDRTALAERLAQVEGDELQAGGEVPAQIQGRSAEEEERKRSKPFVGALDGRHLNPPAVVLRPTGEREDRLPPKKGFLFVSIAGDEVRLGRREAAWERIRSCSNPMPQLGMLIEGRQVQERHGRRLTPMTPQVREVFPSPNDRQLLALDVALNTPDIALIQGPPGTGKTRVIAALQARLAESDEANDPDGLSGNTLLTSYQHDAVETAAAATRVLGLPAVKVGHRKGEQTAGDEVDAWRVETAQAVRAARSTSGATSSVHGAWKAIRALAIAYIQSPAERDDPVAILARAADIASPWVPGEVAVRLAALRGRLQFGGPALIGDEDRGFALKAVRGIRASAAAFEDDGPRSAHAALRRLRRLAGFDLDAETEQILQRAAEFEPGVPPGEDLLEQIGAVRDKLIDRLQPPAPVDDRPRVHADVEAILTELVDAVGERARRENPGVDASIEDWLSHLENDPEGVREAVQHYSMTLAATCQQCVGKSMTDAKSGEDTVFRSVIGDEAARANPLDLLIPLSIAERRIVLVGDHRQLPHILEPEIERELEQSIAEETREALRQSLFQKLFTELRERQKSDGVKRTVTLNVQYRMHPLLGDFVSQQFYEPHGEGFESGREASEFAHDVALADGTRLRGRVGAWLDVPSSEGLESPHKSKSRDCEARRVAREAAALVKGHPELSVGVITFYARQRDLILKALDAEGITEPDDDGGYRVKDQWQRTSRGKERLRVGTVDAFQGKEFDVVLLSMTRSNRVMVRDEKSRRARWGFLLLENRLCVAMSRQHRLLIVVGDLSMLESDDASDSVPGLVAFQRLCGEPHGTIVR